MVQPPTQRSHHDKIFAPRARSLTMSGLAGGGALAPVATDGPTKHATLLDLARGVSAQLVVIGHLMVMSFPGFWARPMPGHRWGARPELFQVQSYAVVVFLVLSGYVITRSVRGRTRAGRYVFRTYALDRAARILTPLLPAIPLVLVLDRLVLGPTLWSRFVEVRHDAGSILANVFLLQDNAVIRGMGTVLGADLNRRSLGSAAPWWTVCYEWWIYLAFGGTVALVLWGAGRRAARLALALLTAFAMLSVVGFAAGGNFLGLGWLIGFAYAWWEDRLSARRTLHLVTFASGLALIGITLAISAGSVYSVPVVLGTGLVLMTAHRLWEPAPASRSRAAATFLAKYSYSLYLIHFSVLVWMASVLPHLSGFGLLVPGFIIANVASWIWWWLTEARSPDLRRRLRSRLGF